MSRYGLGLYGAGYYSRDPFPLGPLVTFTELLIDGAWTTALVYGRDGISISRGRSDESSTVDRSTCRLTLNNRDGRYSPRNPTGIYFGKIGRNTRVRVGVEQEESYLYLTGTTANYISTPDTAALSFAGDIEVQADVTLSKWQGSAVSVAGKWGALGFLTWLFQVTSDGHLALYWSENGTDVLSATSTEKVPFPAHGRLALKVTLDVNDGAGGWVVHFYTAPTIDDSWTELGERVGDLGVTTLFNSTSAVVFGAGSSTSTSIVEGKVHAGKVLEGIGGTVRANPDVRTQSPGVTSFSDGTNTWTVSGTGAAITNRDIRFTGEVPSWPVQWDVTGTDVYVPIEASGILRRMSQGSSPLRSALFRAITSDLAGSSLLAYWPMEDGDDATRFGSALEGGKALTWTGDLNSPAGYSLLRGSAPIPMVGTATITGRIPARGTNGVLQVRWMTAVPTTTPNGAVLMRIACDSVLTVDVSYSTGGALTISATYGGVSVGSSTIGFGLTGLDKVRVSVELSQSGGNVDWTLSVYEAGATSGSFSSGTFASAAIGRGAKLVVNPNGDDLGGLPLGHITAEDAITTLFDVSSDVMAGYSGETAGRRMKRLCEEESLPFFPVGDMDDTQRMGYQGQLTLIELLRECEAADGGILYEPREYFGLGYRTRVSMYSQTETLTLDYSAKDLSGFEPVDDDQNIRNDVTVVRKDGSSARAVLEEGTLSVLESPNGVGRYDTTDELSLESDVYLDDQAGWKLNLGTVDKARFPVISVNLARSNFANDAALTLDAKTLDIGDKLAVLNSPEWLPQEDVEQLAQGFTERLNAFQWEIDVNCSPEEPWHVLVYDEGFLTSDGSSLLADINSSVASFTVETPSGPLWTHDDGDYDIVVGGEQMTVTGVTDLTATTQTFNVIRSVNGVVKSHSANEVIELAHVNYWGL